MTFAFDDDHSDLIRQPFRLDSLLQTPKGIVLNHMTMTFQCFDNMPSFKPETSTTDGLRHIDQFRSKRLIIPQTMQFMRQQNGHLRREKTPVSVNSQIKSQTHEASEPIIALFSMLRHISETPIPAAKL